MGFNPYTYCTQNILSVYLVPFRKKWDNGFYVSGGPKYIKIRVWTILTLLLKVKKKIVSVYLAPLRKKWDNGFYVSGVLKSSKFEFGLF